MSPNPSKFSFEVQSRKFLAFFLTNLGIEENSYKFQDIINLANMMSVKEVQQLMGRIISLSIFLSCVGDKASHFSQLTGEAKGSSGPQSVNHPYRI